MRQHKLIIAFNRDRDSYQVAAALAEAGMLARLVTDFYRPDAGVVPVLRHRSHPLIPSRLTSSSLIAFLLQSSGPLFRGDRFWYVDKAIGNLAARSGLHSGADLLLYSRYAFEAFTHPGLENRLRGLFVFHPHPKLIQQVLEDDLLSFPEYRWSSSEGKPSDRQKRREDVELKKAHHIIAASSFTKRSVIQAGVSPAQISVVPYGTTFGSLSDAQQKRAGTCRFLFVGQGIHRKGLHHLLAVWRELELKDATLAIVTHSVDEALLPILAATPNLRAASNLSADALKEEFRKAHVFVMPSLVEGFGLVYGEALANGCYTIGTENTGLPDLGMPPGAGAIISPGDRITLRESLLEAHRAYRSGSIDPLAIAQFAQTLTWGRFRDAIVRVVQGWYSQK